MLEVKNGDTVLACNCGIVWRQSVINWRKVISMKEINLPPELEFYEDIRLLVYRPHGLLNEAALNRALTALENLEAELHEPFNRFSDTLAADEVELNFKYVIQFSLHRRLAYQGHPAVRSAILATDSTMNHYARLHAILTQGSPIKARVFQDRKEAAQWLGVPPELIAAQQS
jgi:hypothetical protein